MQISKDIVAHTAYLARLYLSDEEIEQYLQQIENILSYIDKLKELDVKDVEPTFHVLELKNMLRKDIEKPSLSVEEVLQNAPDREGNFFSVPKVY
ncbi:MAG: Asp-tRNA(Asn)/Glu-tRNA(Gln) amidotransferase subunit GatC [Candidatus Kaelpia aquatica]|nr:Asp-tRNA(Asn)/Glu-tRNA(Gln) amidotransferase subunit GatC [Candidatus Kaelpia aquatica]